MDTISGIEDKARALLEGRVASVTTLSTAVEQLQRVRDQVAAAEKEAEAAWAAAADAGWTDSELRTLGFTRPKSKRSGRTGTSAPRRRQHGNTRQGGVGPDGSPDSAEQ